MKTTPYQENGKDSSFSKARTSKVRYLNEKKWQVAMKISRRIEIITKFNICNEWFSSENYQVMNYGIGGKISPHIDSHGQVFGTGIASNDLVGKQNKTGSEIAKFGGLRVITFMIYM